LSREWVVDDAREQVDWRKTVLDYQPGGLRVRTTEQRALYLKVA
jgi:hypothetical protein